MIKLIAALAACASLGACATITRGTSTNWQVQTDPVGASVATSHGYNCPSTPCSIRMPRKSQFTATIAKPGYKTVEANIINRLSRGGGTGMAGNVLLGGPLGVGVDAVSGAALDLRPNPLVITMEPGSGTVALSSEQGEMLSNGAMTANKAATTATKKKQ
ncbi:MAG: translation initiation factor 2 [Proteobacteria bacterium]|nr:translation initiation factor 2 [Pseudomonadota bacterium]